MIDMIYEIVKNSFLFIALPYFVYTRVILFYIRKSFYEKQKNVTIVPTAYPILGILFEIVKQQEYSKLKGDNYHPSFRIMRDVGATNAGTYVVWIGHNPVLWISDVNVIQDLYTSKNKLFDKYPLVRDATMIITGRSILFADTDAKWRARRTAISPAFYKGKLVSMVNLAK